MEFTKLISDFAERHGIANLAAEDGAAALEVDGIVGPATKKALIG